MKKILVLAAAMLLIAPMSAMAGMTAFMDMDEMSSNELSGVTGQTGITIDASMQITGGFIAWGDDDGCPAVGPLSGFTTAGFFVLSTITTRGLTMEQTITIDACSDGATDYIVIGLDTITTNLYVAALRIGTAAAFGTGNSLGSLTIGSLVTANSQLRISAHP